MKTCRKCGGTRINAKGACKDCRAAYMRRWNALHPENVREQRRKKKESGQKSLSDKRYRERYPQKCKERSSKNYRENKAHYKAYRKAWYEANKEKFLAQCKAAAAARFAKDPEGFRRKAADAAARRRRDDPQYLVYGRMSCLLRQHLKRTYRDASSKAGRQWPQLVGYTVDDLMTHLKTTVPNGFTWDDYLSGVLEVDHIQPDCTFDYQTVDDPGFKQSWALTNLRLLTAQENSSRRYV